MLFFRCENCGRMAGFFNSGLLCQSCIDAQAYMIQRQMQSEAAAVDAYRNQVLSELTAGTLPDIIDQSPFDHLNLDHDEAGVWEFNEIDLYEARSIRRSTGRSGGVSVRVTRNVRVSGKQYEGMAYSEDDLSNIDNGNLYLTTTRLIFTGSMRSRQCWYDDILSYEYVEDGIVVHTNKREKAWIFKGWDCPFAVNLIGAITCAAE